MVVELVPCIVVAADADGVAVEGKMEDVQIEMDEVEDGRNLVVVVPAIYSPSFPSFPFL